MNKKTIQQDTDTVRDALVALVREMHLSPDDIKQLLEQEAAKEKAEAEAAAPPAKTLKQMEKTLKGKKPYVPAHENPKDELKRLVNEHRAITKRAVAIEHMCTDRVRRDKEGKPTGEIIKNALPMDVRVKFEVLVKEARTAAAALEVNMQRELRKLPLYRFFLEHVSGCGPITAGYLISMLDFHKSVKPSQVDVYCGNACIDGKSMRPTKGEKLRYVQELKTRLWQMFAIGVRQNQRHHPDSKYLKIWTDKKQGLTAFNTREKQKWWIDETARRTATRVFLVDLYIMGRTLEGLDVWCEFSERMTGYSHGGEPCTVQVKKLTLSEAIKRVGVVLPEKAKKEIQKLEEGGPFSHVEFTATDVPAPPAVEEPVAPPKKTRKRTVKTTSNGISASPN